MKKKVFLITACKILPKDAGEKIISWGLLNKLSTTADTIFINIYTESRYDEKQIALIRQSCKLFFTFQEKYYPNIISLLKSFLNAEAFMFARRRNSKLISQEILKLIELYSPDIIIWDHLRTASYLAHNNSFNILVEHNYEAGIYAEKINLYPLFIKKILQFQVKFTDIFNKKINNLMQRIVYLSKADSLFYNLEKGVVWEFRNVTSRQREHQVDKKNTYNLLFVGSLEWYPNIDGISWFIDNVYPNLPEKFQLIVVGKNPTQALKNKIADNCRIKSFYNVPSVESFYLEADIFISPVRLGLGVNMKIIEAASYGIPMVVTSHSLKGYDSLDFLNPVDSIGDFTDEILKYSNTELRTSQSLELKSWYNFYQQEADLTFNSLFNLNDGSNE